MVGRVTFVSASDFSLKQVTQAFNRAFTGYYFPMTQTPDGLADMMRENDVQLPVSLAMLVDDELVGIGLVALRGDRGWIAGMGVDPFWRGQGLGRQLLARLLVALRGAGARTAQLEALTVNTPALTLYKSVGFSETRELFVYQGPLRLRAGKDTLLDGGFSERLAPVEPRLALTEFSQFHTVPPAWQREARTLLMMRRSPAGLGLWDGEHLRAYVIYIRHPGGFVVFDAGSSDASPEIRCAHIVALFVHLVSGREDSVVRAINTPPGDALGSALELLSCPVIARQYEMSLTL